MKEDHCIRKFFKIILVNSQYFEQLKHSITKSWRINGQYICNCYFSTVHVTTVIIVYKEKDYITQTRRYLLRNHIQYVYPYPNWYKKIILWGDYNSLSPNTTLFPKRRAR